MSTRSFTGGVTERGVEGRYVHYDGAPEARLPVLDAIVARDGAAAALRTIMAADRGGWSYLDTERAENTLGADRAEVVPGYGLRYTDAPQDEPMRLEDAVEDVWMEHAYVILPGGAVRHFSFAKRQDRAAALEFAREGWRQVR